MCGIAGSVGIRESVASGAVCRMLTSMRHRGPDGEGIETIYGSSDISPVVLAHTRLAILDPSSGKQPMAHSNEDDSSCVWLTFNGEIYNFRELRTELRKLGLVARTGTDTEVMLLAYCAWGLDAVERFRGMFAFALADPARNRIWLARDRLGIKPLYITRPAGGGFLFASEVRTLLAAGSELVPRRLARPAVESFFAQGAVYGLDTHISNVTAMSPGESLLLDWEGRQLVRKKYWNLPFRRNVEPMSRAIAVEHLGKAIREAVHSHLLADVPVGIFLSGGVDSAAITALATESQVGPIHTVSVGFDRPEFDETAEATELAKALGTRHTNSTITEADICADFDSVLQSMDQPTVDGFNTYYVSRAAVRLGLKVALSGLGGDELFGGYESFRDVPRAIRLVRLLARYPWTTTILRSISDRLGSRGLRKLAEATQRPPTAVHMYLLRRELFLRSERRALWKLPTESDADSGLSVETIADLINTSADLDPGNTVSALELTGYMRNMLLRDADVFSMANGLELRTPLIDDGILTATLPLSGTWKHPGPYSKPLLRDAVGPSLSRQVGGRKKRGFTFPWSDWFRGKLAAMAAERLNAPTIWEAIGIEAEAPEAIWKRFCRHDPAIGGLQILALVVLADITTRQRLTV